MRGLQIKPAHVAALAGVAAAAFGFYYITRRGVTGAAASVAEGAVNVVRDAATGAVIGIGKAVGIPETNASKCAKAVAEGRWWDATFACPAGTLLRSVVVQQPPVDDTILDARDARARGLGDPCSCGGMSAEAWIGLAGVSLALVAHVQNRRRHVR